ncbi:MAG: VOC family protein, partial [Dehalococcoidales bacterium]|nr:VOC family protein [Dehalococcoidales bacterium]
PGCGEHHPTLEIFSYDTMKKSTNSEINRPGFAHIAFEVDDVAATLAEILNAGGSCVGDVVTTEYPNGMEAVLVYARDPEGNIVELQSWRKIRANTK